MKETETTVTEVLQLTVTVEKKIKDCIDPEELRQEIMYAINHKATEKYPAQAKQKGFIIKVGLTTE